MTEFDEKKSQNRRNLRKITKQRLTNIALYYLQRFDSSVENLRQVLQRRVSDYAYHNPEFDQSAAQNWIGEILADFERFGYLNDERYAEFKVKNYLAAGKPARYIKLKLAEKGIAADLAEKMLAAEEYDPEAMAENFARRKKIGPFRAGGADCRREYRQKDLAALVRAGFDYDTALRVIDAENPEETA